MARLIDADALMKNVGKIPQLRGITYGRMKRAVEETPTIDAEPVRHGEWVGTDFDGYADGNPVYYLWQCSCCHEEYERDGLPPWYDYCPNCGAKMDGGAEDGNGHAG